LFSLAKYEKNVLVINMHRHVFIIQYRRV